MSKNWLERLAAVPTIFHLWCAECELRMADTAHLTPAQRQARARNLDALREYRLRGIFPRNEHDPSQFAPCFVDDGGRHCAVAHLMDCSGERDAVAKVALAANFARIKEMHFAELDGWSTESGLTKEELARIQPGYPPELVQLENFMQIMYWLIPAGTMALVSIAFNFGRMVMGLGARWTTILLGFFAGVLLIGLGYAPDSMQFAHVVGLWPSARDCQFWAVAGGIASVFASTCALIANLMRRSDAITPPKGPVERLDGRPAAPRDEHVTAIPPGAVKTPDPF